MTEAQWDTCSNPQKMLTFLRGKASERKLRLYGCAICRHVWHLFTDERSRRAVDMAERYADGLVSREEMTAANQAASDARDLAVGPASDAPRRHRSRVGRCTSWAAYNLTDLPEGPGQVWATVEEASAYALDAEQGRCRENARAGAALLRDIFNPFRPVFLDLSWLTPNVLSLARVIYDERRFGECPVLADALEDASCENQEILRHLRRPGQVHVRGFFVVDLLLQRE
jgi:hypothetical protein